MPAKIKFKKGFKFHPAAQEIQAKVEIAVEYFPEIAEIILARGGHVHGMGCLANADVLTNTIKFNVDFIPSMNTVFHELGHILRKCTTYMPSGEEACSIFALARMPDDLVDSCNIPYIGLVPKQMVNRYCQMAMQKRKAGVRFYIKWLRLKIKADKKKNPEEWPKADIHDGSLKPLSPRTYQALVSTFPDVILE